MDTEDNKTLRILRQIMQERRGDKDSLVKDKLWRALRNRVNKLQRRVENALLDLDEPLEGSS